MAAEGWTALGTLGTLLVLMISAVFAGLQLREQFRPWVTVDFHFRSIIAFVAIKNLGNRPAHDIRIRFEPELVSTLVDSSEFSEVAMFSEPIPTLAPHQERFVLFDRVPDRLDTAELPKRHRVFVEYTTKPGGGRRLGPYEFVLDFAHLRGGVLPDRNVHDLVGAVEELAAAMKKPPARG